MYFVKPSLKGTGKSSYCSCLIHLSHSVCPSLVSLGVCGWSVYAHTAGVSLQTQNFLTTWVLGSHETLSLSELRLNRHSSSGLPCLSHWSWLLYI